jgi:deoxycytidylate deaminase
MEAEIGSGICLKKNVANVVKQNHYRISQSASAVKIKKDTLAQNVGANIVRHTKKHPNIVLGGVNGAKNAAEHTEQKLIEKNDNEG